jgi:hypothetical protein
MDDMSHESVVVVLATRGGNLERDALDALPETIVTCGGSNGRAASRVSPPGSAIRTQPTNSESEFGNGVRLADGA